MCPAKRDRQWCTDAFCNTNDATACSCASQTDGANLHMHSPAEMMVTACCCADRKQQDHAALIYHACSTIQEPSIATHHQQILHVLLFLLSFCFLSSLGALSDLSLSMSVSLCRHTHTRVSSTFCCGPFACSPRSQCQSRLHPAYTLHGL